MELVARTRYTKSCFSNGIANRLRIVVGSSVGLLLLGFRRMPSDRPRVVSGHVWLAQRWFSVRPHPPAPPRTLAIHIRVLLDDLDGVLSDPMGEPISSYRMDHLVPATTLSMATPFRLSVVVDFIERTLGSSVASNDA